MNNNVFDSQLGFLPGNRTSDAHNLRKYCHKKNAYICGCFVDFSRAFDCIPRNVLFNKLIRDRRTGKFLKIIANLYEGSTTRVKLGDNMSQEFENHKGVKQGCILSHLLFNIFLSDLPKTLNPENQVLIHENVGVNCQIWADDLLLSESEVGLQSMLNHRSTYCKASGLEINDESSIFS